MKFPLRVGDFARVNVHRYDASGNDESVGYDELSFMDKIAATVYVYNYPRVVSISSPPKTIEAARKLAAEHEFEARTREIIESHPGATLNAPLEVSLVQDGKTFPGKLLTFKSVDTFEGRPQVVLSRFYLFCFVGEGWTVAYRFTYPEKVNAVPPIEQFMKNLKITIK